MVHVSAQKHVQSQISAGLQVPWFLALDWLDGTGADDFLMWRPMGRLETPKAIRNKWLLLRIHSSIFQHISTIFIIFGWRNPDPQHAACSNVVISGCCSCESSNLCLPKVVRTKSPGHWGVHATFQRSKSIATVGTWRSLPSLGDWIKARFALIEWKTRP